MGKNNKRNSTGVVAALPKAQGGGAAGVAADVVMLPVADVLRLVAAADVAAEHHAAIVEATPRLLGSDTLDVMAEAGVVEPDTLDVSPDLMAAIARTSAAVDAVRAAA